MKFKNISLLFFLIRIAYQIELIKKSFIAFQEFFFFEMELISLFSTNANTLCTAVH